MPGEPASLARTMLEFPAIAHSPERDQDVAHTANTQAVRAI
jgi:hypothetical protein